jgi:bacterioferritin
VPADRHGAPEASPAHSLANQGVAFGNSNELVVICFGRAACYEFGRMKNKHIIKELCLSYAMELETVQNYIAASVNLDGVRSDVIKKALAADVLTEVQHAQQLATRIKTIGGQVPGSLDLPRSQKFLQPKKDTTDVVTVIKGVIKAEEGAIAQYNKIIKLCDGVDYVTQDMIIGILGGEEDHRREFIGFLKEYEKA